LIANLNLRRIRTELEADGVISCANAEMS